MQGFSGDTYLKAEFERLIKEYNIKTVIETGTYQGDTTLALAGIVGHVITIETNHKYYEQAARRIDAETELREKISHRLGESSNILYNVATEKESIPEILFFLDAHWSTAHNPLLGELGKIMLYVANTSYKPVIVIHDMQSPNDDTMGYDKYKMNSGEHIVYNWEYVKDQVEAIYGEGNYEKYYNEKATGARRGALFIVPKI